MPLNHKTALMRRSALFLLVASTCNTASAGPLIDWLLNNRWKDTQPVAYVAPTTYPTPLVMASNSTTAAYAATGYNPAAYNSVPLSPATNYNIAPPTYNVPANNAGLGYAIPQTVVAAMPTGSYQTMLNQVPTTYYRPVTSLDPNTGTTVTSLQPCTSYQQQALRIPLLMPSTYYAAYGNYGAGLQQDRYSSITGSGVASAATQSSLSIPSSINRTSLSPVNQIPTNGYSVTPQTYLQPSTLAYQALPSTSAIAPATLPQTQPLSQFAVNNQYPTTTANYQTYGNTTSSVATSYGVNNSNGSYVQADGSIVTPLGPPTMSSTPTQSYASESPAPTSSQPNTSYYSSQPYTTQMQTSPATPSYTTPTYVDPAYASHYDPNCLPGTTQSQPLGANDVLPPTEVYPSQPSQNFNNYQNNSNPALSDPESTVTPTYPPLSRSNPPTTSQLAIDTEKLVPIERPNAQFTRRLLEQEQQVAQSTFQASQPANEERQVMSAPTLLEPNLNLPSSTGIRPPEGYQPKPYWRSEQKSTTPNALQKSEELTAAMADSSLALRTVPIDREPAANVQQAAHIQFIIQSNTSSTQPNSASERAAAVLRPSTAPRATESLNPTTSSFRPQRQHSLNIDDGFRPVK